MVLYVQPSNLDNINHPNCETGTVTGAVADGSVIFVLLDSQSRSQAFLPRELARKLGTHIRG